MFVLLDLFLFSFWIFCSCFSPFRTLFSKVLEAIRFHSQFWSLTSLLRNYLQWKKNRLRIFQIFSYLSQFYIKTVWRHWNWKEKYRKTFARLQELAHLTRPYSVRNLRTSTPGFIISARLDGISFSFPCYLLYCSMLSLLE